MSNMGNALALVLAAGERGITSAQGAAAGIRHAAPTLRQLYVTGRIKRYVGADGRVRWTAPDIEVPSSLRAPVGQSCNRPVVPKPLPQLSINMPASPDGAYRTVYLPPDLVIKCGPSHPVDSRYQVAPGERVRGAGFAALRPGQYVDRAVSAAARAVGGEA